VLLSLSNNIVILLFVLSNHSKTLSWSKKEVGLVTVAIVLPGGTGSTQCRSVDLSDR
jgi:hypothetical protein